MVDSNYWTPAGRVRREHTEHLRVGRDPELTPRPPALQPPASYRLRLLVATLTVLALPLFLHAQTSGRTLSSVGELPWVGVGVGVASRQTGPLMTCF